MLTYDNVTVTYDGCDPALVAFSLEMGDSEIVALVGESGSGKTTAIRAAIGLLPGGGAVTGGDIRFEGRSLLALSHSQWCAFRGREMSMIFQDCGAMLDPIRTIGSQFVEYIRKHEAMSRRDAWQLGQVMLERMGLPHSRTLMKSYAFQLSGGMRQRVGIAMAMVFQPKILLADEPTSALDVTMQAQIVRQMQELREQFHTSILLVTHNLGLAAYVADRIFVMTDGRVVESGDRDSILDHAQHAYTRRLLEAVPDMRRKRYV